MRKGGRYCNALTGDSRHHSIAGSMKVETRPCTNACPGGVEIPEYMELMRAGDLDGAARRLLAHNPMPAVTGRVCPHACEDDCNRGLFDQAVSVREVERFLGVQKSDRPGTARDTGCAERQVGRRRRLGAGRSGRRTLSASARSRGHRHRARRKTGRHASRRHPAYRLSPKTVEAVVEGLAVLGVEIRCGVDFGSDVTLKSLRADHDAVFLATGAWALPRIGLDGEEELAAGLAFLSGVADGEKRAPGPRVLVVGGGERCDGCCGERPGSAPSRSRWRVSRPARRCLHCSKRSRKHSPRESSSRLRADRLASFVRRGESSGWNSSGARRCSTRTRVLPRASTRLAPHHGDRR